MVRPLITAIRTLTILPVPGRDTDNFSSSVPFFPVVGFILGGVVYGLLRGANGLGLDPLIAVIIVLAVETVLTGALHIDGLGDIADGFGSRKSKEDILTIMKDPRMGAFGVCAIVFAILIKVTCWYHLVIMDKFLIIIFSLVFARCVQSLYVILLPNARKNSIAAPFSESGIFNKISAITSIVASIALSNYFLGLYSTVLYSVSVISIAVLFGIFCIRKINGITGDCIGAVSELSEISCMIAALIYLS